MKNLIILCLLTILLNCEKNGEKSNPMNFTLNDLVEGNEYTLSKLKGKVVIIDFWATWCKPCQATIPIFKVLYDKYKDKGVLILGIGLDKEEDLRRFIQLHQINYPVLVDNKEIAKKYKIYAIPTTYVIDKRGNIVSHHIGLIPQMQATLEKEIKSLL